MSDMPDKIYVSENECLYETNTIFCGKHPFEGAIEYTRAQNWLPIETAPKDGTHIDVWHKSGFRVSDVTYIDNKTHSHAVPEFKAFANSNSMYGINSLTHWMPLPTPPKDN
jgi:hypothetical protein